MGSFATVQEPTGNGSARTLRTGRGGEAAGLWRGRDSMLFRWRGCAGPPLVAFCSDAAAPRPKRGEDSNDHREYLTGIVVELVAIFRGIERDTLHGGAPGS